MQPVTGGWGQRNLKHQSGCELNECRHMFSSVFRAIWRSLEHSVRHANIACKATRVVFENVHDRIIHCTCFAIDAGMHEHTEYSCLRN